MTSAPRVGDTSAMNADQPGEVLPLPVAPDAIELRHLRSFDAGGVPSLLGGTGVTAPPTMVLLHGGLYVMSSAFGYRHLAGALAMAADTTVIVPEYRLAPEHPYPAAMEDAIRAFLWLTD